MHITLFMATSVNGMIARPDYREDFLSVQNWDSFLDCARRTGSIIWGRRTHEKVRAWGSQYFAQMIGLHNIVVSTDSSFRAEEEGFEAATSPRDGIEKLSARGHTQATLAGGAILNSSFAREGLIDAVVLNVESVIIARGIPLLASDDIDLPLKLVETERISDRIVQLRYTVVKA